MNILGIIENYVPVLIYGRIKIVENLFVFAINTDQWLEKHG